jgi:lipopolysaccharide biosynthesis regulator YciM
MRYHMSMLDNLAAINTDGIRAFVKSERERWTCKDCGGTIDVHHYRCSSCGKAPE